MMRAGLHGMLGLGMVLAISTAAFAQPDGGDPETRGRAKFDAGREELGRGHVKEALALFQESWALHKSAGTLLNIGNCEEKLGRPASAWKHYQEALGLLPPTDKRVPGVKELVGAVEPHVPKLRIQLDKGAPAGTKVTLGDKELNGGDLDTDLPLDPGTYTIQVKTAGFATRTYQVVLEDGEKETARVEPSTAVVSTSREATSDRPPASDEPGSEKPFPTRTVALVAGGAISAVGVGLGIAGLVLSSSKRSERDEVCTGDACPRAGEVGYDDAKARWTALDGERVSLADAGIAGFVIGGVALAATGVAFLVWKPAVRGAKTGRGPEELTVVPLGTGASLRATW